ncbi:hypothetical protein [Vreelandella nanhaiensis]|uniref:DUF3037 domain-containing protein n=1 Tax=Vreelandella nanhaiensis TaxID=1258546 RepID=A0A433KGA6_9GAMM|nr:hypothetical protein [Halomonas nanhaiensis]RUR27712.1 hypothetical protein ELY38_18785 [Halomonas nanhaiensis]
MLIDEIFKKQRSVSKPLVKGSWYRVQWTPDVAASERLNIGIAFVDSDGGRTIQTIDEFARLRCLYGQEVIFHAQLACQIANELVQQEKNFSELGTPQLHFIEGGFAQGDSAAQILSRLVSDLVPLSISSARSARHVPVTRKAASKSVYEALALRLGRSTASKYIPEEPTIMTNDGFEIFLPFRREADGKLSNGEAATLVSADFTKPEKVQSELLVGHRDISLALREKLFSQGEIFILRPNKDSMRKDALNYAEAETDKFARYLTSMGIPFQQADTSQEITEQVQEWCLAS